MIFFVRWRVHESPAFAKFIRGNMNSSFAFLRARHPEGVVYSDSKDLGTEDFILLLGEQKEIENGVFDTAKVKAFRVPAGVLVEVFATSLHYAPCHTDPAKGFRMLVALPEGTNTERPDSPIRTAEDALMTACNKWLLAHPDSPEAKSGAKVGLVGENIDIADLIETP